MSIAVSSSVAVAILVKGMKRAAEVAAGAPWYTWPTSIIFGSIADGVSSSRVCPDLTTDT